MTMSSSQMANAVSSLRLRADVFDEAYERMRRLPYSALRDVADSSYTQIVVVRDGKKHRVQVRVQRTQPDAEDVQVTVKLRARGRWHPEILRRFVKRSQRALSG